METLIGIEVKIIDGGFGATASNGLVGTVIKKPESKKSNYHGTWLNFLLK